MACLNGCVPDAAETHERHAPRRLSTLLVDLLDGVAAVHEAGVAADGDARKGLGWCCGWFWQIKLAQGVSFAGRPGGV